MDDKEIYEKVKEAVVEALGVDPDEVKPESVLFDDLGAESLDLLDIVFRLEKAFDIKIPRGGIQQDILAAEGVSEQDVIVDGALTELGAQKLRERLSEVNPEKIKAGFRIDDIPTLFTVQTFVNIVKQQLAKKET
ncbi:MAG: acyl carrier protein [Desulfobacterota bacterium]|nr:acyl carrier protein [Thermodesulfobacteriota bacterium]